MFNYTVKGGIVDFSVVVRIVDETTGVPELGVLYNTAGIDLKYRRELAANVSITEATLAALTTAHADGGFLEIGNGYYRLDLPDAAVAAGVKGCLVHGIVTGMVVIGCYIEIVAYDPLDTVRLGLTAMPNAAADAAGGLPISDAGGLDLDAKLANTNEVTVARMGVLTDWINGGRLDLILDIIAADTTTDIPALLATIAGYLDTEIAAILADTNELQTDWANGGRLDLLIDAILADTAELQTDWVNGGRLDLILDIIAADTTTDIPALLATIDGIVDDILVDTAVIGALGAGLTAIPWNAAWDAEVQSEATDALNAYDPPTAAELVSEIDSVQTDVAAVKVDTAAILVDTGTTLDGRIPAALTGGGNMKSDMLAINGVTAAAARLALSAGVIIPGTVDTTAFSSTTTEFEADDITTATADFYNGRVVIFTSGALLGQATSISDYVLTAGRGHFTVVALTNAPANDVTFVIV